MTFDCVSRVPNVRAVLRSGVLSAVSGAIVLFAVGPTVAQTQAAVGAARTVREPGIPAGGGFDQVLGRLDGLTLGLIAAAVLILGLLVWRVLLMVRRERPAAVPQRRGARSLGGDTVERSTLQASTDWGFDQNKRAALARSPVAVDNSKVELSSIERAVTQWSASDVFRANEVSVVPPDSLGSSPAASTSPYRTGANPYFHREQPIPRIEVEEVADTLLQAELLVQLGDPKQAMTLLSHHIRETEKPGPAVWLMLLNLYQSTGREAQYNALATGFRLLFNAEVPPWASSASAHARDLESYPQVMAKLQAGWTGPQVRADIDALLNDDRGGSRQGFSLTAYRDLLFLAEVLETIDLLTREEEDRHGIRRKLASAV